MDPLYVPSLCPSGIPPDPIPGIPEFPASLLAKFHPLFAATTSYNVSRIPGKKCIYIYRCRITQNSISLVSQRSCIGKTNSATPALEDLKKNGDTSSVRLWRHFHFVNRIHFWTKAFRPFLTFSIPSVTYLRTRALAFRSIMVANMATSSDFLMTMPRFQAKRSLLLTTIHFVLSLLFPARLMRNPNSGYRADFVNAPTSFRWKRVHVH